jgi:hypothetical protein
VTEVQYSRYEEAYRAIHSALSDLTCPPPGEKITKQEFGWNADGSLSTLRAFNGLELLFTLTFTWVGGNLQAVERT